MSIKQKKINYSILILFLFALIFAIIVIKSPGNIIRAEKYTNKHLFIYTVYKSLIAVKSYFGIWLPFIIYMIFIFYDYGCKMNVTL